MTMRIAWVSAVVSDLSAAVGFFQGVLGLPAWRSGPGSLDAEGVWLAAGGAGLLLLAPTGRAAGFLAAGGGLCQIALGTDDLAGEHQRLTAQGLRPTPIREHRYGRSFDVVAGEGVALTLEVVENAAALQDGTAGPLVQDFSHAALLVSDLEASTQIFRKLLGREPDPVRTGWSFPELGVRATFFRLPSGMLELNAPITPGEGPLAAALAARGPHLLGMALRPHDLDAAAEQLTQQQIRITGPVAVTGAGPGGGDPVLVARTLIISLKHTRGARVFLAESR